MKAYYDRIKKEMNFKAKNVNEMLKELKIMRNTVIVVANNEIVDEDYNFKEKDKVNIVSFNKEFGFTLDKIVKGRRPCSVCGVLRRSLLNTKARELGATKLVTGHNLDDEAQTIIMNQFRRNIDASSRLGPLTGNE